MFLIFGEGDIIVVRLVGGVCVMNVRHYVLVMNIDIWGSCFVRGFVENVRTGLAGEGCNGGKRTCSVVHQNEM